MSKISAYAAMPQVASGDLLAMVDISDSTMAATGTTKKVLASQLAPMHKVYVDQYGSDPTGATLSDSAFTAAFAAAASAVQTVAGSSATAGAVVVMGEGIYTVSTGVIATTDARIGLTGAGKAATLLRTTGTGIMISMRGGSEPGTPGGAPVGGFTTYGWDSGANAIGLRFGDRPYSTLYDIYANGWNNGTAATGFQVAGTGVAVAEGVDAWGLMAKTCSVAMDWNGTLGGTSVDYSRWKMHAIDNNVALQIVNGAHSAGGQIQLTGTAGSANWANPTVFLGGNSGTDAWNLQNCFLDWGFEANSGSSGVVKDMVLQGTSASGIQNAFGNLMFLTATASFSAGSITTSRFSFSGSVNGSPLLLGSGNTGQDQHRADLSSAVGFIADAVQAPGTGGTIKVASDGRFGTIPVNPTANITGVILEKPSAVNQPGPASGMGYQVTVVNRSAFTITFAAAGTSFVADGASAAIPALTARTFTYDTGSSLWYRSA